MDLTTLSHEELRAEIRMARTLVAAARRDAAVCYNIHAASRANVLENEHALKLLQAEQQRRSDQATAKAHDWMEEQSNFEKQLDTIAKAIMHHFPEDLLRTASIPTAVCEILERFDPRNESRRALASTDPQPTEPPKQP